MFGRLFSSHALLTETLLSSLTAVIISRYSLLMSSMVVICKQNAGETHTILKSVSTQDSSNISLCINLLYLTCKINTKMCNSFKTKEQCVVAKTKPTSQGQSQAQRTKDNASSHKTTRINHKMTLKARFC